MNTTQKIIQKALDLIKSGKEHLMCKALKKAADEEPDGNKHLRDINQKLETLKPKKTYTLSAWFEIDEKGKGARIEALNKLDKLYENDDTSKDN